MDKINDQLDELYSQMEKIASIEVERLARDILKKNKSLHEFVMGMGTWFFTYKNGETISPYETRMNGSFEYYTILSRRSFKPLADFMGEWNDILKLTGESMRFTATSKKITDW